MARHGGRWAALLGLLVLPLAAASAEESACASLTRLIEAQSGTALFLPSYPTAGPGPLHNVAFLYDNAVAAIALVGCGQLAQGRRIGNAMLLGLQHDRYWHDGRLRNGYAAGVIDEKQPLKLGGWWDRAVQRWLEDGYQAGSDTGNMAWAMLALLTLDEHADAASRGRYRAGALRLAQWLAPLRDERGAGGFTGGFFGHEPAPRQLQWRSTEHNVDLSAAFARLALASADPGWQAEAEFARRFVAAMWSAPRGSFAVGTGADGRSANPMLALDAQIWPLLALPGATSTYAAALPVALQNLRSGAGYAYSDAGGGSWTEGNAQLLLLLKRLHRTGSEPDPAAAIAAARAADGGYYATTVAALPTGFMLPTDPSQPRLYLHLEHLGAQAWVALAEQGFNPFTGERNLPP